MDIGKRVRAERTARHMSQEQLARAAEVSLNLIGRIERSETPDPHFSTLARIAGALDTSVSELVGEAPVTPLAQAPPDTKEVEERRERTLALIADKFGHYTRGLEQYFAHWERRLLAEDGIEDEALFEFFVTFGALAPCLWGLLVEELAKIATTLGVSSAVAARQQCLALSVVKPAFDRCFAIAERASAIIEARHAEPPEELADNVVSFEEMRRSIVEEMGRPGLQFGAG